ncbi:MAG: response regulator transcription factor [Oscillospiraceae bacterium]|nr:response regulator transcription factor [Oscillospiraceae bacterium]
MQELKNKKILIVDDEKELLNMLSDILYKNGFYNVYTTPDCKTAIETAQHQSISLYLLDVNLPDGDGFSLLETLRKISTAPAIFLTARGEGNDRIKGLGLGADDYIIKPFLADELILRVNAVLKRVYGISETKSVFTLSGMTVNLETASVVKGKKETTLTAKEYILIKKLWENKNKIVTNDALCMAAWGEDYYGYENTLMVHIRRLRQKIETEPSAPKHLITVKGLGYKLVIENE